MAIKIQYKQTSNQQLNQFQNQLIASLQPILNQPQSKTTILTKQSLASGANTIQTGLGYPLTGWYIIRQRAQADIWDSQDSNKNPNNTLILNASAAVVCDIAIF